MPETSLQNADGSIIGGTALGASNGSGSDGGVGMIGSAGIALTSAGGLVNNQSYAGKIVPQIGPYPLVQDVSFPWFEGTTFSSTASSWLGASLHEMSHAFGLPHDFRNDANFHGSLMGNGLRGCRGAFFPSLYPSDDAYLSYGQALVLNSSRYFNEQYAPETTAPTLNITTSGTVNLVNGQLEIAFTASDSSGLASAYLDLDANLPREISLTGTSANTKFVTPYFAVGTAQKFYISIYDIYGNRTRNGRCYVVEPEDRLTTRFRITKTWTSLKFVV